MPSTIILISKHRSVFFRRVAWLRIVFALLVIGQERKFPQRVPTHLQPQFALQGSEKLLGQALYTRKESGLLGIPCLIDSLLPSSIAVRSLGYPEEFIHMWDFYLCYCEGGFRECAIGTAQVLLGKPLNQREALLPILPMTEERAA